MGLSHHLWQVTFDDDVDKAVRKLPKAPSSSTTTAKVGFRGALPAPVFGWLIQYYLFIYVVRYDSNHKLQKNLNYYIFYFYFFKIVIAKTKTATENTN